MKNMIIGAVALAFSAGLANAQQYDRNIEEAAIRIVAEKMGQIRGGFDADQKPVFVKPIDRNAATYLGADRQRDAVAEMTASIARAF